MGRKYKKRGMGRVYLILVAVILSATNVLGQIKTGDYEISVSSISERIKIENYRVIPIAIKNNKPETITISMSLTQNITEFVTLSSERINIPYNTEKILNITIFADKLGHYSGALIISSGINEEIPVEITVSDIVGTPVEAFTMVVEPLKKKVYIGNPFRFKIDIQNLLSKESFNVTLHYFIGKLIPRTTELNVSIISESESILVDSALTIFKKYEIPDSFGTGEYVLNVTADYLDLSSQARVRFFIRKKLLDQQIFGFLPMRWVVFGVPSVIPLFVVFLFIKKHREKKKRYKSKVDFALLPKPGPRTIKIGKIAETNKDAYFDIDQLTMHTLIAGSTGGGKTVSAEVLIEEALLKGVTVLVFDPTAQWTGFLRRCQNKKMLALYPQFGLKKSDAKAFNGNIHQILNARQIIDIKKYMIPGEIHCFAVNRLDPEDIDILVSNTVREIFHANLPEATELKMIVIFDEVHRLLPKFGGSGKGFVQIERGAREFRKWGVGLILISQVLTDFVGETKANINTEIQMRTRDQGDLDRIKNKYGGYMLQSLLKASTGTGMLENPAYNRGNPYFVTFRPLLHEHARLSDEELENYNKYNEIIENLEYEIEQLKEEDIDVFDLKLELKMALDKVKSGSFNMVDIYLEGLKPRLKEHWKKLGKQAKKREIKLVDEEELEMEFEKARKAREDFETQQTGKGQKPGPETQQPVPAKESKPSLPPLKLSTGETVTKVQELVDAVNVMDDSGLEQHVNAEKNDFADWIKPMNEEASEKLRKAASKDDMIAILEELL